MLKKLSAYIGKYKTQAILSPILVLIEVVLEVFIPLYMGKIVDVGIPNKDIGYILQMGGLMVLMAIGALIFGALCARVAVVASNGMVKNLRKGLFERIESFSFKNTDHFTTPSLITRLTNDVNNIQNSFQMIIRMLARAPFMLILASVMAYRISPRLSVIIFAAIPVLALVMFLLSKTAFPLFSAMLKKYDSMNARTQENLVAIRVVKAFVRGDYESVKFKDAAAALKNAQRKAEKVLVFAMPVMQITMYASILLVLLVGGKDILAGNLLTGQLMSFISYITQILMSLMMIMMVFVTIVLSSASAKRIIEVLDETPAINDSAADETIRVENGSVEFKDVSFSYAEDHENLTLTNINLSIRSGETIGIIGGSGSAKSTLVQLIPRLYEVYSGELLVGGHNVKDYKIDTLRASIGMVLQKNVLFTVLTADGANLSQGQRQLLAIARAAVANPPVLILDEATSSIDTRTESLIEKGMDRLMKGRTVFVIAHRLSTVRNSNAILVLEHGEVIERGDHEDLLGQQGKYYQLYMGMFELA